MCGLATRTPEFDIVWHRISSDPRRQAQIVGHELGHLILDHDPDSDEVDFHELANQLLGMDIPRGATTLGARGFTNYDSPEEYEAELFGSLLVTHPARHLRKSDGSRPATFRLF
ncbi:MAG: hypothetical protein WAW17_20525 [Rhodococcus sp. (in: high G+C Gram-positive bacteria)]|uniref:ImmA/IrrE family metallo-endopeptidase n=1 Tax=Rhodococcus sp. TaxID=1831 RepID=UPI003BB1D8D1